MAKQERVFPENLTNVVQITGLLKEMDLQEHSKDGKTAIRGHVTVLVEATGDMPERDVRVEYYVSKMTNAGKENKAYKGIQTAISEYVSMADVVEQYKGQELPENWKNEVTKVSIKGQLRGNVYVPEGAKEAIESVRIGSSFINRVKGEFIPKATFQLEGILGSKIMETKVEDDEVEETGRLKVKMMVPDYSDSIFFIDLIVADEDAVDYIQNNYNPNLMSSIWGELNFIETTVKKVTKAGFGKDKVETFTNSTKEFIITGGEPEQIESEESSKFVSVDTIKKANVEYQNMLEEKIASSKKTNTNSGGKGFNNGKVSDNSVF